MGLEEPGSQLTSALNRNKILVSKKTEAQMHTQEKKKRYFYARKEVLNGVYMLQHETPR